MPPATKGQKCHPSWLDFGGENLPNNNKLQKAKFDKEVYRADHPLLFGLKENDDDGGTDTGNENMGFMVENQNLFT
ncbi:hypothetical protein GOBAR_DD08961 [Gossypium barbadense]|nr:hypothetical protein GOBAR_DD08961 [Gossypium barbadense]